MVLAAAGSSKPITESWPWFIGSERPVARGSRSALRLAWKDALQNQCRLRLLSKPPPETVRTERTTGFFFFLGLLSGLAFQRRCN